MPPATRYKTYAGGRGGQFAATRWSMVLLAGRKDATQAAKALEQLCSSYWYPLYAFVRRQGFGPEDAQDLTQDFFARLTTRDDLQRVDPSKGKFRSFLLAALQNFLANEWERRKAQKRGGGCTFFSLDAEDAEARYKLEPMDESSAEELYERRWAETLIDQAVVRLRAEYERSGKKERFEQLKPFLSADSDAASYAEIAVRLGVAEGGVKSAVHRMRQRFGELFREEIANTLANPTEVDEEMRHLFAALS